MRIAIAARTQGRVGGVEHYVATVVPLLVAGGHDVACWFETTGAGCEPILPPGDGVPAWTAEDDPAALDRLRDWHPDLVFVQGLRQIAHERALLAMAPAVLFAHDYYGTCISGSKTQQAPAMHCCTRVFGPSCLVEYFPRRCGGRNPITMLQLYGWQRSRNRLLSSYTRILVASRHMADEYARHGFASRVRVVHLPIESTRPVAEVHEGHGWRLLYLGRLERAKGPEIALESAARVAQSSGQPVHLRVAGDGSMRGGLEARAGELMAANALLRVTFTGWIDAAAATVAIDQSDLLLVPSTWPEPFGMAGVEAALRGVPAVAFAVGGIPEWLEDGVTGRLVPADPPDAARFANAIQACLSDRSSLMRMRAQSRAGAARFAVAAHLQALEQVFFEATSARAALHSPMPSAIAGTLR